MNRRAFLAALVTAPVAPLPDGYYPGGFQPGEFVWLFARRDARVAYKLAMSTVYGKFGYTTAESSLSEHTRRRIELGRARFCQT